MKNLSTDVFLSLLRAGLWEQGVQLEPYGEIDFEQLYDLADNQSVVGLVAAGLEQVKDRKIIKKEALPFLKRVYGLEQRNLKMNAFIELLVQRMRDAGIYSLLVKGQGIAQCYIRPLWRSSGDVDFFLDEDNYKKAKAFLLPLAQSSDREGEYSLHLGMTIDSWTVELHGSLRCGLSSRMDQCIDCIQYDIFNEGKVRIWQNEGTAVFLPSVDEDVIFVFTHFLNHFYKGGIGLRQICDWCRLIWTYRGQIDIELLRNRLRKMGLAFEWKAFATLAVDYLGMSYEAMPLYEDANRWHRKARRILSFILKVGNFGQNRDLSYYHKYPYLVRKAVSLGRRLGDLCRHSLIFPLDSLRFLPKIMINGARAAARGE